MTHKKLDPNVREGQRAEIRARLAAGESAEALFREAAAPEVAPVQPQMTEAQMVVRIAELEAQVAELQAQLDKSGVAGG